VSCCGECYNAGVEVRLLGRLEVVRDGATIQIAGSKRRALLACLALRVNEPVSADFLIDALWGESPPATARASLHNMVARLRRMLGGDVVVATAAGYELAVDAESIDVHRFELFVRAAREEEPRERAVDLRRALSLWRGAALADFVCEPFAQSEAARLEELRLTALEERIDADLALGRGAELVAEVEALVEGNPLRERLRGQLMLALYRAGRQAEALAAYQDARRTLVDELGIEPSPALRELEQAILRQDEAVAAGDYLRELRSARPAGTVSFLFTDVERSTRLLVELGEGYRDALAEHRRALREAFVEHGGGEVDTQGDAFFAAFPRARDAVAAAEAIQRETAAHAMRTRIGIHTGEPFLTEEGYVGMDVNRGARICSVAHGGQVLVSQATRELLTEDLSLRDLGLHRLKDVDAPVRLFQLGYDDFPPLPTMAVTNLPAPPTALVGRGRELSETKALLAERRLLVFVGAGGSGKTRLALELAGSMVDEFEHGVWWVPLEAVTDPDLVLPSIAQALGAKDDVARHIGDKSMLLVLDCFEHVANAADHVARLLGATTRAKALVTSREPLRITGEQRYEVSPLQDDEAEALFLERSRERDRNIEPSEAITEICRRLDNLPLAIELAAARVAVLSPQELLKRLERRLPLLTGGPRDAPERQRTLRATIEWSHRLLSEDERELFARLSVFAGSFDLDSADAVAHGDINRVTSLVEKSLLEGIEGRFRMLDSVREYAAERLGERKDAAEISTKHARHYLDLAETAEGKLGTADRQAWIDRVSIDEDNFRASLEWTLSFDPLSALRLVGALHSFWFLAGHFAEGRRWANRALEASITAPDEVRARALSTAGDFAGLQGDFEEAEWFLKESLKLRERCGNDAGIPATLTELANVLASTGRHTEARRMYELALERQPQAQEEWFTRPICLNNFGFALLLDGEREAAVEVLEEGLRDLDEAPSTPPTSLLLNLAWAHLGAHDLAQASQLLRRSLAAMEEAPEALLFWEALEITARLAAVGHRARDAARAYGAAQDLATLLGVTDPVFERLASSREYLAPAQAALGDAVWLAEVKRGHGLSRDEALSLARSIAT
jgi:predicted ATPase/DNA-binding SARP family transcriptional activator/Tfp pilus assembly protein PilF